MVLRNKKGFSVIEILMVITIIIILTAMVAPNFTKRTKQARMSVARVDIEVNIAQALDTYEMDNGRYPSSEQGLAALVRKPSSAPVPHNWNGPYLKKKQIPTDPWSSPYVYESPGMNNEEDYDLSSYGPDGVEGEDDIVNWVGEDSFE
jgi:general secretion pathway protein G